MGQVLHGRATTTEAVRRAIQASEESVRVLARRYGISPTTVQKWRKRTFTADAPMGPKAPRSTVLSPEDEAVVVAFRRHTLLPLDDCLYALQPTMPHLTRSSLHRCLQRHGIARLPEIDGVKPKRSRSRPTRSASSTSTSPRCGPGRAALSVRRRRPDLEVRLRPVARAGDPAHRCRLPARPGRGGALHASTQCSPTTAPSSSTAHPSTRRPRPMRKPTGLPRASRAIWLVHAFDHACEQHRIEHRTTKPAHPWTNGQVERMNRTLKDATVRRYHYGSHDELRHHLQPSSTPTTTPAG